MVKLPDWIYRQSAVLPYRLRDDDLEVLLITSRKGTRWVLPKGIVEPGMTPTGSAAKEALEEAGVEGEVSGKSLGNYDYKKWGGTCHVEVFPMQVTTERAEWPEVAIRQRAWLPIKAAAERVKEGKLRKIIGRLPKAIKKGGEAGHVAPEGAQLSRVIYLFRHAKSSWDDPTLDDFDRPLAPRGEHASQTMQDYMRLADVEPDLVLCSASMRTRQTLDNVLAAFGGDVPVKYERRLYHGGAGDLMSRLRRLPEEVTSVMMIGHNPALQILALELSGGGDSDATARLEAKFPTAGLATFVFKEGSWWDLAPGCCELHSFVVPRELE